MTKFKGTKRKINVDPFDQDQIFVGGHSLDNGNIDVWVNQTEGEEVTPDEALNNANLIAEAFSVAQTFGSVMELQKRYLDALNALKIAKNNIEFNAINGNVDPIVTAVISRVLKKEPKN